LQNIVKTMQSHYRVPTIFWCWNSGTFQGL